MRHFYLYENQENYPKKITVRGWWIKTFCQNVSKRSLSIIFIMVNYNADQKIPLSFDPDHKNAPSFCQIKKCSFCFDPNSEPKKNASFFDFFFIDPDQKKILCLIRIKNLSLFFGCKSKIYVNFSDLDEKIIFLSR